MDKDSYNIDNILSEVKKRREENETEIKAKGKTEPKPEEVKDEVEPNPEQTPAPADEVDEPQIDETVFDEPEVDEPVLEEPKLDEPQPAENEMVDILQFSDDEIKPQSATIEKPSDEPDKAKKAKKKKAKKFGFIVLIVFLVAVIAAAVYGYIWARNALDKVQDTDNTATTENTWTGMDTLVESFEPIQETEATELASLNDMIKTWYYNGTPCSSSHVLNVLLIGEDTRGTEILDEGTRADSAIIVSVNIDTKEITLTSILRDSWAYWENTPGDESTGEFGKINGAMSNGDINAYVNCIEKLFKVDIDNYVIVNFDSFESIVDELGGVTLELTTAEINEINNHPKRYGNVTIEKTFDGDSGAIKLTGKQALAYCRIRKIDSDNARADRQKNCLIEIFNEAKEASSLQLLKIVNTLIPYVKTGFNKSQIVQIAKYAFSQGWLDYDTVMQNMPDSNLKGGLYYSGQWIWRADYPADAYTLQMDLYSKASITLAHIRVDTAKCPETGFYSEGASAMYTTITNNNYGEATTKQTTTKKQTTTSN